MPTHLLLQGSSPWVLNGFFSPVETGLDALTSAGAMTIEVSDFALDGAMLDAIQKKRLSLIVQCYPKKGEDLSSTIALAKRLKAIAINAHVKAPHLPEADTIALLRNLMDQANEAGIPFYVETHRGTALQDLVRTYRLVEALPDLKFTLDVSHYIVCEELPGPTKELEKLLDPILDRTEMIHGRISNGQQVQTPIINANGDIEKRYVALWTEAMRRWRIRKPVGSALIFTPELGPPPYAVTDADEHELSNRLEQCAMLWTMAQTAWKASASAGKTPAWPLD